MIAKIIIFVLMIFTVYSVKGFKDGRVQRENKTAGTERGNIVIELILKSGKPNSLVWQERNSIHRQFVSTHIARIRFPATPSRATKRTCCAVARHLRGVAFLHRRYNSICAVVRAERAAHRRYRHVKRNTCRLDIFLRYDILRQRIHHHARSRTVAATEPAPHIHQETSRSINPPLPIYLPLTRSPHASPICMTILPSAMAECKRILAIHIYRRVRCYWLLWRSFSSFPASLFAISILFHFHSLSLCRSFVPCVYVCISLSIFIKLIHRFSYTYTFSPFLHLRFAPFFADSLPFSSHCHLRRSRRCRRQSAVERRWNGKREVEV